MSLSVKYKEMFVPYVENLKQKCIKRIQTKLRGWQ